MKKTFVLIAVALTAVFTASAQDENEKTSNWTFKNVGGINLSQTALSNWAAGGDNSVAWHIYLNANANYKKDRWTWDNALVTDFGQTYTSTNKWQKSLDKLNLTSKVGYGISKHWYGAVLADFLTQFDKGYASATDKANGIAPISKFMAPGYLTTSIGFDYKPKDNFSLFLSPATGKFTFVTDQALSDAGAYGVTLGKKLLAEFGATAVANYSTNIADNISLISKLTLFSAYNNNFGNVDVNWDTTLAFKVNKYISANFAVNLVYDDDIKNVKNGVQEGPKLQVRQVFGLGLAYSF